MIWIRLKSGLSNKKQNILLVKWRNKKKSESFFLCWSHKWWLVDDVFGAVGGKFWIVYLNAVSGSGVSDSVWFPLTLIT